MKITRKEIRKLVKEEAKRELPISYYSDEMLIEEGLMDLVKGLFGSLVKFFGDAFEEAEKKTGSLWSKAESDVQAVAQKLLGKDKGSDIKSFDDLDLEKKDHKKIYFTSLVPVALKWTGEMVEQLNTAATVKDWTPADDTEEAAEKWEKEHGETARNLWKAFGGVGGTLKWFAEKGITQAEEALPAYEANDGSDAIGAAKFVIDGSKLMRDIWTFAKSIDIKGAGDAAAGWEAVGSAAQKVGQAIESSAKEQQKESLELRKLINHMIIEERKIIKENK